MTPKHRHHAHPGRLKYAAHADRVANLFGDFHAPWKWTRRFAVGLTVSMGGSTGNSKRRSPC